MATIAQIQNILLKAKEGQIITLNCRKNASEFQAKVVQLAPNKIDVIDAESWVEDWPPSGDMNTPLYFKAKTSGCTVALIKNGSPYTQYFQYSIDNKTWTDYTLGSKITLENVGDVVYFRANPETGTGKLSFSTTENYRFKLNDNGSSGNIEAYGNIMSLVDPELKKTAIEYEYQFASLFTNCKCLTKAPNLWMMTLTKGCYYDMFLYCTSLTDVSELPATTLKTMCYYGMFRSCSSLVSAPEIKSNTLTNSCCGYMFSDCPNVSSIKVNFTQWVTGTYSATPDWLNGVKSSGTFTCPSALAQKRGTSYIPKNWEIVTF